MSQQVFVVISTAKEYSDHQKRQVKKKIIAGLWGILIGFIGSGYIYYSLYQAIHP